MNKKQILSLSVSAFLAASCLSGFTAANAEDGNAVKIIARYDTDGKLTSVELDKNYSYTGTVEAVEGAKVFVWDSLAGIKPIHTTTVPEIMPDDFLIRADDASLDGVFSLAKGANSEFTIATGQKVTVYGEWTKQTTKCDYVHTDGKTYSFTNSFRAGSGSKTQRSFMFQPEQACIVTAVFTASDASRTMNIYQSDAVKTVQAPDPTAKYTVATLDVENPSAGPVYVYGGSSNKDLWGIFVEYYNPNKTVYHNVSGNVNYTGTADMTNAKLVFTPTEAKDGVTEVECDYAPTYNVSLVQNASYDISIKGADGIYDVVPSLDTNKVSVYKQDVSFDINILDSAPAQVSGDVVVDDVYNDDTTLDLSNVQLTFTAQDKPEITYTTGITDGKINVTMEPNHIYNITASGNDGYTLSALSSAYMMKAGDTSPYKNILFTENYGTVAYTPSLEVGADKQFKTVSAAVGAVAAMTDRPQGEDGRVTIAVDPGTYREQVIVNPSYITLKSASETEQPTITYYYGIGYLYYSADNGYYSAASAADKTEKNSVTRWGSTVRVVGTNFIAENIYFENSFNMYVTDEEKADGVTPAEPLSPQYSDGKVAKPDRTVDGYNAKTQTATERAAALAVDGTDAEFYNCKMISSQDTLYTGKTAYFKNCHIEGQTDYIFGGNSVVFDTCTLAWHGYSDAAKGGYISACKSSSAAVAGEPNENWNGYLFDNCTVANGADTDMKFAAGGWGRNWGGADCQVVFRNTTIADGAAVPTGWTAMGGALEISILYVDGVTQNGAAVDTTAFNPNGTMAANGYNVMSYADYFGNWTPIHYTAE